MKNCQASLQQQKPKEKKTHSSSLTRIGNFSINLPMQRDHHTLESAFKSKTHRLVVDQPATKTDESVDVGGGGDGDQGSVRLFSQRFEAPGMSHQSLAPPQLKIMPGSLGDQQAMFFTSMLMRQQQRESARTHAKVSKPVKPHVSDVFETDPNIVESIRSETADPLRSAIATEQLSSPSVVIRNKHVKTMTQLLGAVNSKIASHPEPAMQISLQCNHNTASATNSQPSYNPPQPVVGRNSHGMSDGHRPLFNRKIAQQQMETTATTVNVISTSQQALKAKKSGDKNSKEPLQTRVYKTMTFDLRGESGANHRRVPLQDDAHTCRHRDSSAKQRHSVEKSSSRASSTVLLTKNRSVKNGLCKQDSKTRKSQASISIEPSFDTKLQLENCSQQPLVQQVVHSSRDIQMKQNSSMSLKNRRNNSTIVMNQPMILHATGKQKGAQYCRVQLSASNQVAQPTIINSSNNQSQASSSQAATSHTNQLAANKRTVSGVEPTANTGSVSVSASRQFAETQGIQVVSMFTKVNSQINHHRCTLSASKNGQSIGGTVSNQLHRSSFNSKLSGGQGGGAQSSHYELTQPNINLTFTTANSDFGKILKKQNSKLKLSTVAPASECASRNNFNSNHYQAACNESLEEHAAFGKNHDKSDPKLHSSKKLSTAGGSRVQTHQSKSHQQKPVDGSKEQSLNRSSLALARQVEKRTISAAEIQMAAGNSGNSLSRLSQTKAVLSRNSKHASQNQPVLLHQNMLDLQQQTLNTLQTTSSVTTSAIGSKKEIKCVVTKQTKFNEDRSLLHHGHFLTQRNYYQTQETILGGHEQHQLSSDMHLSVSQRLEAQNKKTAAAAQKKQQSGAANSDKIGKFGGSSKKETRHIKSSSNYANSTVMVLSKESSTALSKYPKQAMQTHYTAKKDKTGGKQQQLQQTTAAPVPISQVQSKAAAVQQNMTTGSADKCLEKIQRRQIVQKIKSQLVAAFDINHENRQYRADINGGKSKLTITSDSAAKKQSSRTGNMIKTFDEKIQSPVLKSPSLFLSTPTREQNPLKPQRQHVLKSSITQQERSSKRYPTATANSERKVTTHQDDQVSRRSTKEDFKKMTLLDVPVQQQKSLRAIEKKFESPRKSPDSQYESQISAPQEVSSPSQKSPSKQQSRGVKLPQSVAKATKQKLASIQMSWQIDEQRRYEAQSRNQVNKEIRFSQRVQRTMPILAAPEEPIFAESTHSNQSVKREVLFSKFQSQMHVQKKRRSTVFSDSHSIDILRTSKPTFKQPQNKTQRQLHMHESAFDCQNELSPLDEQHQHLQRQSRQDSSIEPSDDVQEDTKHIPPVSLSEELSIKAQKRLSNQQKKNQVRNLAAAVQQKKLNQFQQQPQKFVTPAPLQALNGYDSDSFVQGDGARGNIGKQQPMVRQLEAVQAPEAASMAHQSSSILDQDVIINSITVNEFSAKQPKGDIEWTPHDVFDKPENEAEDSLTNGAFSDSQIGDVADEENYNGVPIERSIGSAQIVCEDLTVVQTNHGRPTAANLSGKYTSCMNKNEQLSFQTNKRLATVRAVNNVAQTEGAAQYCVNQRLETAKQILSKKGSKCKCPPASEDDFGQNARQVCSDYCKHLSSRKQKKIVKKLLLQHYKSTIEGAVENNQKLTMAQIQNPFMLQANFGCLGDRKFLISASWWSKWCDYVNFTTDEYGLTFPKESFRDELLCDTNEDYNELNEGNPFQGVEVAEMDFDEVQQNRVDKILRLSIYQQSSFATLAEAIENENEQSQLFYERPGAIENQNLLETEVNYRNEIKKTVVEHFDYEVVPHSVWQHLYSWYSADVTVCRRLALDSIHNKNAMGKTMLDNPFQSVHSERSLMGPASETQRQSKYRVYLELYPTSSSVFCLNPNLGSADHNGNALANCAYQNDRQALDRRVQQCFINQGGVGGGGYELDEIDDPTSNDTTQLLYKQHIEDHSSTYIGSSLMASPERVADSYYRRSPEKKVLSRKNNSNFDIHQSNLMFTGNVLKSRQSNMIDMLFRKTVGATNPTSSSFVTSSKQI